MHDLNMSCVIYWLWLQIVVEQHAMLGSETLFSSDNSMGVPYYWGAILLGYHTNGGAILWGYHTMGVPYYGGTILL